MPDSTSPLPGSTPTPEVHTWTVRLAVRGAYVDTEVRAATADDAIKEGRLRHPGCPCIGYWRTDRSVRGSRS